MSSIDTRVARLRLVTAAAVLPISLADAKVHLRVDHTDDDGLIGALIGAAVDHLDGKSGYLFRALMPQTYEYTLDGAFPSSGGGRIDLPIGPATAVTGFSYIDANGSSQAVNVGAYSVHIADGLDNSFILPSFGAYWPSTRCQPEAVTITYTAGYADADSLPPAIRAALLLMIGQLYRDRDQEGEFEIRGPVAALLNNFRRVNI